MNPSHFHRANPASSGFRPIGRKRVEPLVMDRKTSRGHRLFRGADGFEVALPEALFDRLVVAARAAAPNEWYARLAGRVCTDLDGVHVLVTGLVPDEDAEAGPGFVRTTIASERKTRSLLELVFPESVDLGPAHSHVGCGANYSETDRQNQARWLSDHAVGIVVDPGSTPPLGVYRGPGVERLVPVEALAISRPAPPPKARGTAPPPRPPLGVRCSDAIRTLLLAALAVLVAAIGIPSTIIELQLAHWGEYVSGFEVRLKELEARRAAESAAPVLTEPSSDPGTMTCEAAPEAPLACSVPER